MAATSSTDTAAPEDNASTSGTILFSSLAFVASAAKKFMVAAEKVRCYGNDVAGIIALVKDFNALNADLSVNIADVVLALPGVYGRDSIKSDDFEYVQQENILPPCDPLTTKIQAFGNIAKDAYKQRATRSFEKWSTILFSEKETTLYHPAFWILKPFDDPENIIVVIRGTHSIRDIVTDINAQEIKWPGLSNYGYVHGGIVEAAKYVVDLALPIFRKENENRHKQRITVVGHSLGGAVATYCAAFFREKGYDETMCFAFGAPPTFEEHIATQIEKTYTIVNRDDVVPRLCYASIINLIVRALNKHEAHQERESARNIPSRKMLHTAGMFIMKSGQDLEVVWEGDARREVKIAVTGFSMISDHQHYRFGNSTDEESDEEGGEVGRAEL